MSRLDDMSLRRQVLLLSTIVLLGSVFLFALAEGAVRLRQYLQYGDTQSIEEIITIAPNLGIRVTKPDVDVVLAKRSHIQTNNYGFRSPSIEPQVAQTNSLRLAFLGGSTTFGAEATDNSHTWPAQIAETLQQKLPCVHVEYINAAVPGHRVPQSIINYENRVKQFHPDFVFIYHGHNDLSWESQRLAIAEGIFQNEKAKEGHGFLSRNSTLIRLIQKNVAWRGRERHADAQMGRLQTDLDVLAGQFEDRMNDLAQKISADGAIPVVITFSARGRLEQPESLQVENVRSSFQVMPFYTPDDILTGYDRFNAASRRVAEGNHSILIENESVIPGDGNHFDDAIHLNDRGMKVMADHIATSLLASSLFREQYSCDARSDGY